MQSIAGSLLPVPRGSHPTMSKRSSSSSPKTNSASSREVAPTEARPTRVDQQRTDLVVLVARPGGARRTARSSHRRGRRSRAAPRAWPIPCPRRTAASRACRPSLGALRGRADRWAPRDRSDPAPRGRSRSARPRMRRATGSARSVKTPASEPHAAAVRATDGGEHAEPGGSRHVGAWYGTLRPSWLRSLKACAWVRHTFHGIPAPSRAPSCPAPRCGGSGPSPARTDG